MFGSETIEVVIGLVFIYFLISLLCTTLTEWIARVLALRARSLRNAILKLLQGSDGKVDLTDGQSVVKFVDHPLIKALTPTKSGLATPFPSSLTARTFAVPILDRLLPALSDEVVKQDLAAQAGALFSGLQANLKSLPQGLQNTLRPMLNEAVLKARDMKDVVVEFRSSIEKWFDEAMQRLSGQYKRKAQIIVACLAVVLCFGWNVDTFAVTSSLYHDANLRASVVAAAEVRVQQGAPADVTGTGNVTQEEVNRLLSDIEGLNLPIGWPGQGLGDEKVPDSAGGWLWKVLGIMATVVAVSLGSSFWFDLLNKLVNLRAGGKAEAKKEETAEPSRS